MRLLLILVAPTSWVVADARAAALNSAGAGVSVLRFGTASSRPQPGQSMVAPMSVVRAFIFRPQLHRKCTYWAPAVAVAAPVLALTGIGLTWPGATIVLAGAVLGMVSTRRQSGQRSRRPPYSSLACSFLPHSQ